MTSATAESLRRAAGQFDALDSERDRLRAAIQSAVASLERIGSRPSMLASVLLHNTLCSLREAIHE